MSTEERVELLSRLIRTLTGWSAPHVSFFLAVGNTEPYSVPFPVSITSYHVVNFFEFRYVFIIFITDM